MTLIDMAIALGVMSILAAVIVPNALEFARKRQVEAAVRQTHAILDAAKWFWVSHTGRAIPKGVNDVLATDIAHRAPPNIQPYKNYTYDSVTVNEHSLGERGYYVTTTTAWDPCMGPTDPAAPSPGTRDALCNARVRWGSYMAARAAASSEPDLKAAGKFFSEGKSFRETAPTPPPVEDPPAPPDDPTPRFGFWVIPHPVPTEADAFNLDEATGYWPGQLTREGCANKINFELAKKELAPYLGGKFSGGYQHIFTNPWHEEYLISLDDCSSTGCAGQPEVIKENCWLTLSSNIPEQHSQTYTRMVPLGICDYEDDTGNYVTVCPEGAAPPPDFVRCCARIPWPGKEPRFRRWRANLEDWYCAPWETTKREDCSPP